jgi:hypothetical protein
MIAPTYFDSGLGRSAGNTVAIVRKLPKFFAILLMGCLRCAGHPEVEGSRDFVDGGFLSSLWARGPATQRKGTSRLGADRPGMSRE